MVAAFVQQALQTTTDQVGCTARHRTGGKNIQVRNSGRLEQRLLPRQIVQENVGKSESVLEAETLMNARTPQVAIYYQSSAMLLGMRYGKVNRNR